VISTASNFIGRLTSGYIAAFTQVLNLVIVATFSCALLIFGMIGLSNQASVVALGVVYGYFAGICKYFSSGPVKSFTWLTCTGAAMAAPLFAMFTPDVSEIG
jgi:hypothetical protein